MEVASGSGIGVVGNERLLSRDICKSGQQEKVCKQQAGEDCSHTRLIRNKTSAAE
jgi:hypothetical protein